jgi:dTDP-glucose 4,6-dehydratase
MGDRILVTGGAGFIGSNLVHHLLSETQYEVVNLDLLTYAGNPENLEGLSRAHPQRYRFVHGDICDRETVLGAMDGVRAVLHLAAESHVDRSIRSDRPFVRTNVMGTQTLLEVAREVGVERFVHVSTDEVYGELPLTGPAAVGDGAPSGAFTEASPLAPRSPYAASKAGADLLALSHHTTHGLGVVVVRSSNTYGPRQHPEKLIPLMTIRALEGEPLPVYGDGLNVRDWMHVDDHVHGLVASLERGRTGRVYNLGGGAERTNLQVVHEIVAQLGRSPALVRFVEDRRGHDRRYAVATERARGELGWSPQVEFEAGLARTLAWYTDNTAWWKRVCSGAFREYVARHYGSVGAAGSRAGSGAGPRSSGSTQA